MAEITMDRDAYEKLRGGKIEGLGGDSKLASFLAGKFEEGEGQDRIGEEPNWVFNIWTWRF